MGLLDAEKTITDIEIESDDAILARSIIDPTYFEILVDRYQDAFTRKAKRIIYDNPEAVSDVVQDAFVKIYLNASKFKVQEGASFKSWAYKVLINTCLTRYNKLKGEKIFLQDVDPEILEDIIPSKAELDLHEKKLDTDYIMSYISKLPVILGRVLELYAVQGKSQKDIATQEGISLGAVRARIHRAKKEIKKLDL